MKYKKIFISVLFIGILFLFVTRISIITVIGSKVNLLINTICELKNKLNWLTFKLVSICFYSVIGIVFSILIAKLIDFRKYRTLNTNGTLSKNHPKINAMIGLFLLAIICSIGCLIIYYLFAYLGTVIARFVDWISHAVSKLDAVIIVALITGTISLISVIISSIVAKFIDYKKNRKEYLSQKREEPYGQFVDMVYKIQQNSKNNNSYTEEMMIKDLSKFSKKITLWGSTKVVKKWVDFREKGANSDAGVENLFILEEIMNEMRKDLGLRKVKKGNLLAFFINDIKEAMKNNK